MFFRKISKSVVFLLLPALALFFSPHLLTAAAGSGSFVGFVYAADRTTPMEGAVLKLRNVQNGDVVESPPSNADGIISLSEVEPGLYLAGISSESKDFNFEHLIGIRPGITGKVAFSLVENESGPDKEEKAAQEEEEKDKRRGILGFFTSPAGLALLAAAATGSVIALAGTTTEEVPPASPFR